MDQIIAFLFDKFKSDSPTIAAFTLLVLGSLNWFFANEGELLGGAWDQVGYWITVLWMSLQGSRTTRFIKPEKVV